MSTRTKTLPNHREGVREVMLDSNGKVLPVIAATRVSYTPDRVTTYQRPEVDGFVVRCTERNGRLQLSVNRYIPQNDLITPITDDMDKVDEILRNLNPTLKAWLGDVNKKEMSNLLPAGFGWDGIMTETEYAKHSRIRDLFISVNDWSEKDKLWFENIVNEAVKTSTFYLNLDWEKAFKVINGGILIQRYLPETKVYVVTFDKENNRTLHLVRRPIHTCKKSETIPEIFRVPKGTVRSILLRTNVMVDHETYGVSIDLYK